MVIFGQPFSFGSVKDSRKTLAPQFDRTRQPVIERVEDSLLIESPFSNDGDVERTRAQPNKELENKESISLNSKSKDSRTIIKKQPKRRAKMVTLKDLPTLNSDELKEFEEFDEFLTEGQNMD